jgi:GDPmannose 4,6-dehydratase
MSKKRALITGITGQDGSYLAEFLINKGYDVYGLVRRSSTVEKKRIEHIYKEPHLTDVPLFLEYGDLADASSIRKVLTKVQPDEVYI